MPSSLATARCVNHADRPAFAVCVSCAKTLCQSCATPWDGRYYCIACLAVQRQAAGRRRAWLRPALMAALALALFFAAVYLRAWVGALLAEVLL
jgi:hypothetical protein